MTTRPALDRPAPVKRPKDRKGQIALAAAELFCERGYHAVGIDEIAQVVGITGPAVYRHFPNKYAILVQATRELADAALAATSPPSPAIAPDARLDAILVELARLAVQRRRVGGLYQWEGRFLEPADRSWVRGDLRTVVNRIATPLSAIRPVLSSADARLLARAALSLMGSLATHRSAIAASRARELLRAGGWCLLRADLAPAAAPAPATLRHPDSGLRSRRETIMAAALRLFHLHGYHSVTMEDVAAASGTRASSLYRHFAAKNELLAAVYYRAADRVAASTATALSAATSLDDALGRLINSYVDLVFGQSELVTVYQVENMSLPDNDRHELRKAQRAHVEEWVRIVERLRPDLTAAECRILVHGAFNLISDLGRYVRFDRAGGADRVVAGLAQSLLWEPQRSKG